MNAVSRKAKKYLAADTVALLFFEISAGLLVFLYEWLVAGSSNDQLLLVRILFLTKFLGARLCGMLTDWLRSKIPGTSTSILMKRVADTIAVLIYQDVLYTLSATIAGMSWEHLRVSLLICSLGAVSLGWLYGRTLDRQRAKFEKKI